jgi:hypothetical protein
MALALEMYLDCLEGRLVKGLSNQDEFVFNTVYQGSALQMRVYPVIPTFSGLAPFYSKLSLTNLDLQIVLGPRAGADAIKAAQYTWTKQTTNDSDGKSGYFYATLDLNTSELETAIGSLDSITYYLEFRISESAVWRVAHQRQVTVISVVKNPTGAASIPTPAASYYTAAEIQNLFVRKIGLAGETVIFTSPDGASTRELGCNDDKSGMDNVT